MTVDVGLPAGSRAVLVGVSAYEYAEFPPIRAARNSVEAMRSLLADQALCGWPPEWITVIANPISAASLATQVADLAEGTTGVLLLYYVGHGVLSASGELCLTVTSTRPDRPKISGLPWETLAEVLRSCPAAVRLAILDCCFAGQAAEALAGDRDQALADVAHVEGVYTLTATTRNRAAHAPPPDRQDTACTSFTGELRDLVRFGIPGKGSRLTFGDIYPVLRQRLSAKGLPAPSQRGTAAVGQFPFSANADASAGPVPRPAAAAAGLGTAPQEDPAPVQQDRSRYAGLVSSALRAAHAVTDEGAQAQALATIAGAVAATDPSRAARLTADAERLAQSMPDPAAKGTALAAVVQRLAAADADHAERVARSITDKGAKASALAAVAGAAAAADAGRAARLTGEAEHLIESIPEPAGRAAALAAVARNLAATNPDRAEHLAQTIPGASLRAPALAAIAEAVTAADPDRAARIGADAERLAQAIPSASLRAPALAAVARAIAVTNPRRAAQLIIDAERLAQSIPDPARKAAALAAAADGLAVTDPDRAEHLAQTITDPGCRALALAAVAAALAAAESSPAP
jgi:hypothetical protein